MTGAEVVIIMEGLVTLSKAVEAFSKSDVTPEEREAITADISSNRNNIDRMVAEARERLANSG